MLKYMKILGNKIVNLITLEIGNSICGLVFDGWRDGSGQHYVGMFIVFNCEKLDC